MCSVTDRYLPLHKSMMIESMSSLFSDSTQQGIWKYREQARAYDAATPKLCCVWFSAHRAHIKDSGLQRLRPSKEWDMRHFSRWWEQSPAAVQCKISTTWDDLSIPLQWIWSAACVLYAAWCTLRHRPSVLLMLTSKEMRSVSDVSIWYATVAWHAHSLQTE